jgi:hypothetical protein
MSKSTYIPRYAIRTVNASAFSGRRFVVAHPKTRVIAPSETVTAGSWGPPLTYPLAEAQTIANRLTAQTGEEWTPLLAPERCPSCGRDIAADDYDFCHPTDRTYTRWRAGCNKHDFGCGFEVFGGSRDTAVQAWNEGRGVQEFHAAESKSSRDRRLALMRSRERYLARRSPSNTPNSKTSNY